MKSTRLPREEMHGQTMSGAQRIKQVDVELLWHAETTHAKSKFDP